jgi:DNA-directed RNA polymerase subunit M/transcription elongation factor TFIIS
MVWSR